MSTWSIAFACLVFIFVVILTWWNDASIVKHWALISERATMTDTSYCDEGHILYVMQLLIYCCISLQRWSNDWLNKSFSMPQSLPLKQELEYQLLPAYVNVKSILWPPADVLKGSSFLRRWTRTEPPSRRWRSQWRPFTTQVKVRQHVSKQLIMLCAVTGFSKRSISRGKQRISVMSLIKMLFFCPWSVSFCETDGALTVYPGCPRNVLLVALTWIFSNFPLNSSESSLLPVNWQFEMFVCSPQKRIGLPRSRWNSSGWKNCKRLWISSWRDLGAACFMSLKKKTAFRSNKKSVSTCIKAKVFTVCWFGAFKIIPWRKEMMLEEQLLLPENCISDSTGLS